MISLNALERDLLALLEEAEQEDAASLLNTVRSCIGRGCEREEYRRAIARLIDADLIEIEKGRDPHSLQPTPFTREESLEIASERSGGLRWSNADRLWIFPSNSPRLEILLTSKGLVIAREILNRDGWPRQKPWRSGLR